MERTQFYKYATWGMLLLNLVLLSFLFLGMPPHNHGKKAIDLLKMDETQHNAFLASANRHDSLMNELTKKQKDLLKPYFKQLIASTKQVEENQLSTSLNEIEKQKIQSVYQHFKEIKNILRAEQMADFEVFMNDMLARIFDEKEKRPHPPKDF